MHPLNVRIAELIAADKWQELEELCLSEEYQALPYAVKNYHFITSSKLKALDTCQLAYKYEYVDLVPKPEEFEDKDYFVIGSAFDDLLTFGVEEFEKRYKVVSVRYDVEDAIEAAQHKADAAKAKTNKDGSRSAVGVREEQQALAKIQALNEERGKTQLTQSMKAKIDTMHFEYMAQKLFNPTPKKKIFFLKVAGFVLKAELDGYIAGVAIDDIKTSANVTTIKHEMYLLQGITYNWVVEENTNEQLPYRLNIVDKNVPFARSRAIEYRHQTLSSERYRILALLEMLKMNQECGIWPQTRDQETAYNSPYYGYNGYGRPTEWEII